MEVGIKCKFNCPYDNSEIRRICVRDGKDGDIAVLANQVYRIENKQLVIERNPKVFRMLLVLDLLPDTNEIIIGTIEGLLRIEWLFPGERERSVLIYPKGLFFVRGTKPLREYESIFLFYLSCWKFSNKGLIDYLTKVHGNWSECALNGYLVKDTN